MGGAGTSDRHRLDRGGGLLGAGDTPEALLKRADEGVYEAKAVGPQPGDRRAA
jgi:hypothetical protein